MLTCRAAVLYRMYKLILLREFPTIGETTQTSANSCN